MGQMANGVRLPFTIEAENSISAAIDLNGSKLKGIEIPSGITLGDPAYLSFQGSADGVNFSDLYDAVYGEEILLVVVAGTICTLNETLKKNFEGLNYLKLRVGASASGVSQDSGLAGNIIVGS